MSKITRPVDLKRAAEEAPKVDELHRSHLRMAERLAVAYEHQLRYAHGLGWLVWDGARWAPDRDGAPTRAAVEIVKAAVNEAEQQLDGDLEKDIRKVETSSALSGILRIASCLHPLSIPAERLDTDPYLLNCDNGTLDLQTGELRAHDPGDLITKIAGCEFDPRAHGSTFETFIGRCCPGRCPRVRAARRRAGPGRPSRGACAADLHRHRRQRKDTLVELLLKMFGDYGIMADPELLAEHTYSVHPTGQADLRGVRLAVTEETDEGRRLAAATVKRLTGGDKIRARRMRQDFFEFDPVHTVLLVTNHKPKVSW